MVEVVRHLVLDSEAAWVLRSSRAKEAKRAQVLNVLAAVNGKRVVPTAVRAESGWDRTDPTSAHANKQCLDDPLDASAADRIVALRAQVPSASVVDAAVAVTAERLGAEGGVVEILTSDVKDLGALAWFLDATVEVSRL